VKRWKQVGLGLGLLFALQVTGWAVYRAVEATRQGARGPAGFDYELVKGPAPSKHILLERVDGQTERLEVYADSPVLLHFWATWCLPCRTELPRLLELADTFDGSPVRVLLVSVDEDWGTIHHFFDGNVPSHVVRDGTAQARLAYAVTTLPDTYVLRKALVPAARIHGARDWSSAAAISTLRHLLSVREK
jgi:thiol-disulfide isomerase/thioredoxin